MKENLFYASKHMIFTAIIILIIDKSNLIDKHFVNLAQCLVPGLYLFALVKTTSFLIISSVIFQISAGILLGNLIVTGLIVFLPSIYLVIHIEIYGLILLYT